MSYSVHQLARLASVSVRTLHFYDETGLLKPTKVKSNGYRIYEEKELLRLQQILFFRELDFSLAEIKKIIDAPGFDILNALKDQKKLIEMKRGRIDELLKTITKTIKHMENDSQKIIKKSMTKNMAMKDEEVFEGFNDDKMEQYKKEAKERWGNTDAYKQSMERTKNWTKADYARIKTEQDGLMKEFVVHMDTGVKSPEIQKLVARHRAGIAQFYDLSNEMYRNLANMYVADDRFGAFYRMYHKDLAEFLRDAINYHCDQKSSS